MTDDAVEIVARAIDPYYSRSSDISKLAILSLREAGFAIVPAATIAQRDATIERLRAALKPFAQADRAIGCEPGPFRFETASGHREISRDDLRAARAAYDGTRDVTPSD